MSLRTCCDWSEVGRGVLASTLIAACFPLLYFTYGGHLTLRSAFIQFFIAWTFATCVSVPANLIPWRWIDSRTTSRVLKWVISLGVLVCLGVVGTAAGCVIFVLTGIHSLGQFGTAYIRALPIVLAMTLLVGTAMSVYETMRSKLEKAALQLRTQELERERVLKLATEARLSSLESRLHPHFLFNTLNSISSLIPEDPKRAEKLVEQMAALLRFSLDSARHGVVPLERELKIVNDYLEIEKARLGDRLRYQVRSSSGLDQLPVPPLALQTLVENSIKHVIAPSRSGGWLEVAVERSDGRINLSVRDSGPGFDFEQSPAGHGLDNLRSRLAALYGNVASIGASRPDGTASVNVTIPMPPS